jgi:hypothetical protein
VRLAPLSLTLAAAGFVAFGLALLVAPALLAIVDLEPPTPTARSDVRAIYGGMELGIGVLLALCARRREWYRVGLVAQGLALGGAAAGRLVSLAADGAPRPVTLALAALEFAGAALAAVALRRPDAMMDGRAGR